MILCEGLHLRSHLYTGHLYWSPACGDHEATGDAQKARFMVMGGCRHEHIDEIPLCTACYDTVITAIDRGDLHCGTCLLSEKPHDCEITTRVTGKIPRKIGPPLPA